MNLLNVLLIQKISIVFEGTISQNIEPMAIEAGLGDYLWCPYSLGARKAYHLIEPLKQGLGRLMIDPTRYKKLNPKNDSTTYDLFVDFVQEYLYACINNPDAEISVCV
jgi:hypothetical protein